MPPSAETTGQRAVVAVPGEHLAPLLGLGRDDLGRHAHLVGEVAQRDGELVELGGDDLHGGYDGRGGSPVGEQLGDRGVELLVAHASGHQQVGVVLPGRESVPQLVGALAEVVGVRGDDPARGRDCGTPRVQRLQHLGVGELGLRDQQRHVVLGRQGREQLQGLGGARRRAQVVVEGVARELALEDVGVLGRAQHDQGVAGDAGVGGHGSILWWTSRPSSRLARSTAGPSSRITAMVPGPMVAPSSQPRTAPPPCATL